MKRHNAICVDALIMTTLSPCRIRESEEPNNFPVPWWWPKLLGGDTLRGPCFQVVGSAPCSGPQETFEVTIWWQYIKNWGEEEACDFGECFFCEDLNGDEVISYGIPECGLAVSTCPAKAETK